MIIVACQTSTTSMSSGSISVSFSSHFLPSSFLFIFTRVLPIHSQLALKNPGSAGGVCVCVCVCGVCVCVCVCGGCVCGCVWGVWGCVCVNSI